MPYQSNHIYQLLTESEKIVQVVKRIKTVEVLERQAESGRVRIQIDLPGGKFVDMVGQVEGEVGQSLRFRGEQPFPLQIIWELTDDVQDGKIGTVVSYTVKVDLSPVAAFVSSLVLGGYLSAEMKKDLDKLEDLMAHEYTLA
jgi:hypothetical protein